MTPEQVVRDFLSAFETSGVEQATTYLTDDAVISTANPPTQGGKEAFIGQGTLIKQAMPDYRWGVLQMTTDGNTVAVTMRWTGTHSGPFRLSAFVPGAPDIPATGKKVSVPDYFVFTVRGDKISGMHIDSGPNGGLFAMLQQLGVALPQM